MAFKTMSKSLTNHKNGQCGCSVVINPDKCIYQPFLDGWEFLPDVGNGKNRGEVFTPRFIVDEMLAKVGLFPVEAIYDFDYDSIPEIEKMRIVEAKVVEPAIGTGNYMSSVLWHKLQYAYSASVSDSGVLDRESYHSNFLKAVASVYGFDIDAGNLQVTKNRLLSEDSNPINDYSNIVFWTDWLLKSLETDHPRKKIESIVKISLNEAFDNWGKFFNVAEMVSDPDALDSGFSGVIPFLYEQHTGDKIPENLRNLCLKLLDSNFKCFNGIVEDDVVSTYSAVVGWRNVAWDWWKVLDDGEGPFIISNKVKLADQIIQGEIDKLFETAENLKKDKFVVDEGNVGNWCTAADAREHAKLLKQVEKLEKTLSQY